MQKILKSNGSETIVSINGKTFHYNGNVSIINGKIISSDECIDITSLSEEKIINVYITGNVSEISGIHNLDVKGNVEGNLTVDNNAKITGNVSGNITADRNVSVEGYCVGDINSDNNTSVGGNCNGNIFSDNNTTVAGNCSGDISSGYKTTVGSNKKML